MLIVAATGVASLVFLSPRNGGCRVPRRTSAWFLVGPGRREPRSCRTERRATRDRAPPTTRERAPWLLAGRTLAPENRSILLEVVVRLLFHSAIVVSVYLLFAGHNIPGGGFAGGLVAGLAFVARYLAGGRYELGAAAPVDAGKLLGSVCCSRSALPSCRSSSAPTRSPPPGSRPRSRCSGTSSSSRRHLRHRRLPGRRRTRARHAPQPRRRGRPSTRRSDIAERSRRVLGE